MRESFEQVKVPPIVAPPTPPMPVKAHRTVVAVVVGGWLKDQTTRTLQPALRAGGIRVVSPVGLDDWRAPIAAMSRDVMRQVGGEVALALIGHSFGAQAVGDAVGELAREGIFPAMVGMIDPVSTKPGIPQPIVLDTAFRRRGGTLRVYYRKFLLGPIRANVVDESGGFLATLHSGCRRVGWGHNTMCHCRGVISELVGMVRALENGR